MNALIHFLWLTYEWRFALMWIVVPGATLVPFAIVFLLAAPSLRFVRIGLIALLVGVFVTMMTMMTVGPAIVGRLTYAYGERGEGVVTASQPTAEIYNSQPVTSFTALVKTVAGRVTETNFKDSDFNIWPTDDVTRYPKTGERFGVRYVTGHPSEFVILSDDGSDFARSLQCEKLNGMVSAARKGSDFAGEDPDFRRRLDEARTAATAAGCEASAATGGSDRVGPNPARRCFTLQQDVAASLQAGLKSPKDLSLRRRYFIAVQASNDAGCPQHAPVDYPR